MLDFLLRNAKYQLRTTYFSKKKYFELGYQNIWKIMWKSTDLANLVSNKISWAPTFLSELRKLREHENRNFNNYFSECYIYKRDLIFIIYEWQWLLKWYHELSIHLLMSSESYIRATNSSKNSWKCRWLKQVKFVFVHLFLYNEYGKHDMLYSTILQYYIFILRNESSKRLISDFPGNMIQPGCQVHLIVICGVC